MATKGVKARLNKKGPAVRPKPSGDRFVLDAGSSEDRPSFDPLPKTKSGSRKNVKGSAKGSAKSKDAVWGEEPEPYHFSKFSHDTPPPHGSKLPIWGVEPDPYHFSRIADVPSEPGQDVEDARTQYGVEPTPDPAAPELHEPGVPLEEVGEERADDAMASVAVEMPPMTEELAWQKRREQELARRARKGRKPLREEDEKGTECSGRGLCARWLKENGTQLGQAEGLRLVAGIAERRLHRPPASYITLKLIAEFLEAQATEEKALSNSSSGTPRAASLALLGSLNKLLLPADKQAMLEKGKVKGKLPALHIEDSIRISAALKKLGYSKIGKTLESALARQDLLTLEELANLIQVYAREIEQTDNAIHSQLEVLSKGTPAIVHEQDVDHYYRLISRLKDKENTNHVLCYGPVLAAEHTEVIDGYVLLKRHAQIINPVLAPPRDWNTLKIIAILFDFLYHMDNAVAGMAGPPGTRAQLGTLGGINRSFMQPAQKADVLKGRRTTLDHADLDILKELSVNAKYASINPKHNVAKGARAVQRNILVNSIFNLNELVTLFTNLALRLYIPVDLYRKMLSRMQRNDMLNEEDAKEIRRRITPEECRHGVHFFHVAKHFAIAMEVQADGSVTARSRQGDSCYSESGTSMRSSRASGLSSSAYSSCCDTCCNCGESGASSGGSSACGSSCASGTEQKSVSTRRVEAAVAAELERPPVSASVAALIVMREFAAQKRAGTLVTGVFDPEEYAQAYVHLRKTKHPVTLGDKGVALAYLASSIARKRAMPLRECAYVLTFLNHGTSISRSALKSFADKLVKDGSIRADAVASLTTKLPDPVPASVLLRVLDAAVVSKSAAKH